MKKTNLTEQAFKKGILHQPNIAVFTAGSYTPGLKMYDDLRAATFTTIVLWSTRVKANGEIHYHNFGNPEVIANNGKFNPGANPKFDELKTKVLKLKDPETTITRVELSIGTGANTQESFQNIATIYANKESNPEPAKNLVENLSALKEAFNLDAVSFDDEEYFDLDSLVWLAKQCDGLGMKVSIVPCGGLTNWTNFMTAVNSGSEKMVDVIYVQAWATGGPSDWGLTGVAPNAGMWLQDGSSILMTPDMVTKTLLGWQENPPTNLAGGWFYNANEVFVNDPTKMKEYSDALWSAFFAI